MMNQQMKVDHQLIEISTEEFPEECQPKYYGNMKIITRDKYGNPKYMLGPHYPLFITAFLACAFLVGLEFYAYFDRFSLFWKIISIISSGCFLLSYLNIALSLPGIVQARKTILPEQKRDHRYCSICQILKQRSTEHCQYCGVCIQELDHHCPWVGKCVGKNNLVAFYVFLGLTFGNMLISFVATSASIMSQHKS